eukprot:4964143-Alexandrium_andersonii.AAC.1
MATGAARQALAERAVPRPCWTQARMARHPTSAPSTFAGAWWLVSGKMSAFRAFGRPPPPGQSSCARTGVEQAALSALFPS